MLAIVAIAALYVAATEWLKHAFYRREDARLTDRARLTPPARQ